MINSIKYIVMTDINTSNLEFLLILKQLKNSIQTPRHQTIMKYLAFQFCINHLSTQN